MFRETKKTLFIFVLAFASIGTPLQIFAATDQVTNPIPVTTNQFSTGVADPCVGKDCYSLFSGFADALGGKLGTLQNTTSLGDFLNTLIALCIGLGGVLTVAMIIYNGFLYMGTDNTTKKGTSKSRILNALAGFILLLTTYTILRTINPDLLNLTPRMDASSLDIVADRTSDKLFQENVADLGGENIAVDESDYGSTAFIMYLYHQQGEGGAPSILWAAKKGYSRVPSTTPFIKGNAGKINSNMANNVNASDMQKILGTSDVTPSNFLKYWAKKVKAAESSSSSIPSDIQAAVDKAATDTGNQIAIMRAICRIESRCNRPEADRSNGQGFWGLFQLSTSVFKEYGKGSNILDYYSNAYAGGTYGKHNIQRYNAQKGKISQ